MSSRKLQPKPGVMDIEIYVPGKSSAPAGVRLHKLSSNETPLGSSPAAQEAIAALDERAMLGAVGILTAYDAQLAALTRSVEAARTLLLRARDGGGR